MLEKKVCMLGDYGVGKRSLTSRFEDPYAGENYLGSISMRICKRMFEVMLCWPASGETTDRSFKVSLLALQCKEKSGRNCNPGATWMPPKILTSRPDKRPQAFPQVRLVNCIINWYTPRGAVRQRPESSLIERNCE